MKSYRLIIYTNSYDNMHDSGDKATKNSIWPLKVIQFKDHEVNWKTIYMYKTSYMCCHNMHHSEDTAQ